MRILLVSTNVGSSFGGEALKAKQYFAYLLDHDFDAYLVTHARCRTEVLAAFPEARVRFVGDDLLQKVMWHSWILRFLLNGYFHWAVRHICREFARNGTVVHYLCPISPIEPRFPPRGYQIVVGPLSGNIAYPPAFQRREDLKAGLGRRLHRSIQRVEARVLREKARYDAVLVSGYERTRKSLDWAGVDARRIAEVRDAGLPERFFARPPIRHAGTNGRFLWMGRMVDYKAADLAVRAVAEAGPDIGLTIYGDGVCRENCIELARRLGIEEQVEFPGWLSHDEGADDLRSYRGFLFTSLAEANGIVMQEAMALGLPVIALRWGGPQGLAAEDEAIFIDPVDEAAVVRDLAASMRRLAADAELANHTAARARLRAETEFRWSTVGRSWTAAYRLRRGEDLPRGGTCLRAEIPVSGALRASH